MNALYLEILPHIFGNCRIHAYVSGTASDSRRLFFSTLAPSDLHYSLLFYSYLFSSPCFSIYSRAANLKKADKDSP